MWLFSPLFEFFSRAPLASRLSCLLKPPHLSPPALVVPWGDALQTKKRQTNQQSPPRRNACPPLISLLPVRALPTIRAWMGGSLCWDQMAAGHKVAKIYNGAALRAPAPLVGIGAVKEGCTVSQPIFFPPSYMCADRSTVAPVFVVRCVLRELTSAVIRIRPGMSLPTGTVALTLILRPSRRTAQNPHPASFLLCDFEFFFIYRVSSSFFVVVWCNFDFFLCC